MGDLFTIGGLALILNHHLDSQELSHVGLDEAGVADNKELPVEGHLFQVAVLYDSHLEVVDCPEVSLQFFHTSFTVVQARLQACVGLLYCGQNPYRR